MEPVQQHEFKLKKEHQTCSRHFIWSDLWAADGGQCLRPSYRSLEDFFTFENDDIWTEMHIVQWLGVICLALELGS
jgi:hypothetical protein